ncbi:MAG TPA: SDR family oxidoreductase [Candidatus Binatia bacterium]|nr:SDR family oxidoreductase [Candidatus Binatia bacterium]
MTSSELAGRTALVTGASSGLGVDFARELARRGCNVVLVARREDRLRALQQELQSAYKMTATVIAADLARPDAAQALHDRLKKDGVAVDVLVNNAGFGVFGLELDIPWEKTREMLMVDIVALTQFSKLFGRDMRTRGFGYLLQVASIGAFQPSPTYAAYSAAKSYVRSFSQALNFELRGSGVSSTVICPGVTATEFLQVSGQKQTWFHRMTMMTSAEVAAAGIRAMLARKYAIVPGFMNWLTALFTNVTPDPVNAAVTYRAMRNEA